MQDLEEITRLGRERLGTLGRATNTEFRMLAERLGPGERIRAMAMGRLVGAGPVLSGRVLLTTPHRFLAVAKGLLTRRERVEEVPLGEIVEVRVVLPTALEIVTARGTTRYGMVSPPDQLSALAETARDASAEPRHPEVDALIRRKLGRLDRMGVELLAVALVEELEPQEPVLDVAACTEGLIAVCPSRVVVVEHDGVTGVADPVSLPFADLRATYVDEDGPHLHLMQASHGEVRLTNVAPAEQAQVIADRVESRLHATG